MLDNAWKRVYAMNMLIEQIHLIKNIYTTLVFVLVGLRADRKPTIIIAKELFLEPLGISLVVAIILLADALVASLWFPPYSLHKLRGSDIGAF